MRAIIFKSIGTAVVEEVPAPIPGADDVIMKVAATGVCHTDIDILHGRYLAAYPVIPGHEVAGTVMARGESVSRFEIGARVVIDPLIVCGHCLACRAGRSSLCETLQAYGATTDGGFASYLRVNARNVHAIGSLPFHLAALAEPFACVLHGVERLGAVKGAHVLIFGAGPIGLMMMMALTARGVAHTTMVDLDEGRLEQALKLGAQEVLHARLLSEQRQNNFDIVVDCTGVPEVCESMPRYARNGASLLFFGVCPPDIKVGFSPNEIFRRELKLIGSHSLSNNIPEALELLVKLGAKADLLISHRLTLDDIVKQLHSPIKKKTMKVQFAADI